MSKIIPRILIHSLLKLMLFMLQTANLTPFRVPIPAVSHFELLDFIPENNEKFIKNI